MSKGIARSLMTGLFIFIHAVSNHFYSLTCGVCKFNSWLRMISKSPSLLYSGFGNFNLNSGIINQFINIRQVFVCFKSIKMCWLRLFHTGAVLPFNWLPPYPNQWPHHQRDKSNKFIQEQNCPHMAEVRRSQRSLKRGTTIFLIVEKRGHWHLRPLLHFWRRYAS